MGDKYTGILPSPTWTDSCRTLSGFEGFASIFNWKPWRLERDYPGRIAAVRSRHEHGRDLRAGPGTALISNVPLWNLAVSAGLVVAAQPVDATLTNALIRECFPDEPVCLAAVEQNLARVVFRLPNRGCLRRGGCFF